MRKSGIYCIENMLSGKIYIGQSVNIQERLVQHLRELRKNRHVNKHLQSAWNKYGEDAFANKVLLYCEPEELTKHEQIFVDYYKKYGTIYNICIECVGVPIGVEHFHPIGDKNPMYGKKHTRDSILKMVENRRGSSLGVKNSQYGKIGNKHPKFGIKPKNPTSKYNGVCKTYYKYKGRVEDRWAAIVNRKRIGTFRTEVEAAEAYDNYIIQNNLSNKINFKGD